MTLKANPYSYELNIGSISSPVAGSGYIVVPVLPNGSKLTKYRDDRSLFVVRLKINGELLFTGDNYRALKTLKDSGETDVDIKIYYSSSLRLTGKLMLYGNWDENKNECACYVNTTDDYNSIMANLDIETNILLTTSYTATVQSTSILRTITLPCFNGNATESRLYYDPDGQVSADPGTSHPDWVWFTLTDTTATGCDPGEFIYEYKGAYISYEIEGEWQPTFEIFSSQYYKIGEIAASNVNDSRYTFFHKEYDIITALLFAADNSLSISPSTYCTYFTVTYPALDTLMIADKSDVRDPEADTPASFEYISLETMLKYYLWLFGLEWYIDSGDFKLKRTNDFASGGYDLNKWTAQQQRYSTTGNKTAKETWKFENIASNEFIQSFFNYGTNDDNFITYDMPEINNDITTIQNQVDNIAETGITWVATDFGGVRYDIYNTVSVSNPLRALKNGEMAAETLIFRHHRINRPYPTGLQDDTNNRSMTPRPDKQQVFNNIPVYDPNEVDFDKYASTSLGNMIVDELSIDLSLVNFSEVKGRV